MCCRKYHNKNFRWPPFNAILVLARFLSWVAPQIFAVCAKKNENLLRKIINGQQYQWNERSMSTECAWPRHSLAPARFKAIRFEQSHFLFRAGALCRVWDDTVPWVGKKQGKIGYGTNRNWNCSFLGYWVCRVPKFGSSCIRHPRDTILLRV